MLLKYCFISFLFAFISFASFGQNIVKGRVNNFTSDTIMPLPNATVKNIISGETILSDKNGNYSIHAKENDQIVFSYVNFTNDTITITPQYFISGYDAALMDKETYLKGVTVRANYAVDSLARREEYRDVFDKPAGITGGNTPQAGVGVSLSPISYFSKRARQKRKFKKRLVNQEEEYYIDYVFSVGRVAHLTGLRGEQLSDFMYRYRPSYELCRQLSYAEMTIYISNKFVEYKSSTAPVPKK